MRYVSGYRSTTPGMRMAYLCNECGNQSSRQFPGGKCPACDSFNIRSTVKSTRQAIREKEPKTLLEIVLMLLLWGALGYGVWERFLRAEPAAVIAPADTTDPEAAAATEAPETAADAEEDTAPADDAAP